MGKSGVSCFRIMSCGRDRVDEDADELGRPEVKSPVDNHRWSFKKRSSRRQIPDNCLISEPKLSIGKKETPRATHDDSHMTASSLNRERLTVAKCLQDTPPLSPPLVDTDVSDLLHTFEDSNKFDSNISESVAVVIQSAVRAYMAGKDLRKRKSVVKLQAAVRGHLARREAIATLRCVQAIVKMQSLVRARRKRLIVRAEAKQNERMDAMGTESFGADQKKYSSTEVLLRNRFARLLLESKPRTKPIYISCEPLKSDSAWKWLERWMAAGCKGLEEEGIEGSNRGSFVTSNVTSESSTSVASFSVLPISELSDPEGEVESFDGSADFKVISKLIPERLPGAIVKGEEHSQNSAEIFAEDPNCQTEKSVQVYTYNPDPSEAAPSDGRLDHSVNSDTNDIKGSTALVATGSLLNEDNDTDHALKRLSNNSDVSYTSTPGGIEEKKFPEENDQKHDIGDSSLINKLRREPGGTTYSASTIEHQAYSNNTSPEMSPTSHVRTEESIGTPSSQNLAQKNNKTEKRTANRKPKIKLANKESPTKINIETKENISSAFPENMKNGKRDPSSAVSEVDADQEPRASISNPLPSYMQTTESVRAKFQLSNSPRANHDDSDKDKHKIKRHSLSTGSGPEDPSSHTHRTASPVQQSLKRNATHSPQKVTDKRWVR